MISFRFGAAGNNYSIYHLLRCSIITGAGYWVQEFNKFRPTRRHSNKKDKKERHILEHNQNGLHGRRKAFYRRVAHGVVNLMFSPTVDELALEKKTLLPVYPSQVCFMMFRKQAFSVAGLCRRCRLRERKRVYSDASPLPGSALKPSVSRSLSILGPTSGWPKTMQN